MKIRLKYIAILVACAFIPSCTGMLVPSVEGYVLNGCDEAPIAGAEVSIRIQMYFPAPHPPSVVLKETTILSDENGFYKLPSSIGMPKGIFLLEPTSFVYVKKEGYVNSRLANKSRTKYLIPEREQNYEHMQQIWLNSRGGVIYKYIDKQRVVENYRYLNFAKYAWAYEKAKKVAETPREVAFLDYFCLRIRQTYASFTEIDHTSMIEARELGDEFREGNRLPRFPGNRCTSPEVLADTPKMVLSADQLSMLFIRPSCTDISNVLKAETQRPHD